MNVEPLPVYHKFLAGGGEMGELTRSKDWSKTPVGDPATWPQSLRTTLGIILNSKFPMFLFWGKHLTCFYNDAYRPSLGNNGKHPGILGQDAEEGWPEIWHIIKPLIDQVLAGGEATWSEDQLIPIYRNGRLEDVYWTFSYSPVYDESGSPAGILVTCSETTDKVLTLQQLSISEQRFRSLIQEGVNATAVLSGSNMVLEMANEAALKLWNKDSSVIGRPLLEFRPELKEGQLFELLDKVYATGETCTQEEAPITFKKGDEEQTLYIDFCYKALRDETGAITGVLAIGTDVTEKVITRKKLEESTDALKFAIEATELGTFDYDPASNKFSSNKRLKEWFGLPAHLEVDLTDAMNAIAQNDRQRVNEAIQKTLDVASGGYYDIEYTIIHPSTKKETIVRAKGRAWFDETGKAYRFNGTLQDVTKQALSRKKVEESEHNLRQMILQAPISIAIFRGRDYVVEIANARALELWGRTEEEVANRPILEAMPELHSQGIKELLDKVYTSGETFSATELPVNILKKGGLEKAYINFSYEPLYDSDGTINGILTVGMQVNEQVEARYKIEESRQRLKSLVDGAPFPIGVYTGREMRIDLANQAILDVWGKGNDVTGKLYSDILPELENQAVFQQFEQVYNTGIPFHAHNQRIDLVFNGTLQPFYFNYSFTPLFNADGKVYGVMNTAADVTALNIAKQKVEESEERFSNIANNAPVLIWMSDAKKFCHFFNTAWLNFTGRSIEQESGDGWTQGLHPDDIKKCMDVFVTAFKKREEYYIEYRLKRHDGEYRWLSENGVPRFTVDGLFEGYIGACMDIHEDVINKEKVKETVEQLSKTAGRLQLALEAGKLGSFELDLASGAIDCTLHARHIFGKAANEPLNYQSLRESIVPQDREPMEEAVQHALKNSTIYSSEYRVSWPDGSVHWIHASGLPFYTEDGKPTQIVGVIVEITEQKLFEQALSRQVNERTKELAQKNLELENMNKELQSFAYVSSHDLQEPLRKIQTFSDHILDREKDNLSEEGKSAIHRMQLAARRMKTLIEDLLAYSRTNNTDGIFETTDLNKIISEIREERKDTLQEKQARIISGDLCKIHVISFQFRQLFNNLISNSLKFAAEGRPAVISIHSETVKGNPAVSSKLSEKKKYCHITFSDNGIGFEPEYSEKIFEVFQRLHTKADYEGTGIGLAIVKKIVDNHHGLITANGQLDKGATFDIYIPLS